MKTSIAKLQQIYHAQVEPRLPKTFKDTAYLRAFGLMKIPLLFSVNPSVVALNETRAIVKIKLNRWTRNHLGSMYFGTMAIGADCVVGLLAVHHTQAKGKAKVHLSFKDFKADFLKRAEGDVLFICEEGQEIERFVDEVIHSPERKNLTVPARAVLAEKPEEPVATFALTLSLKRKDS